MSSRIVAHDLIGAVSEPGPGPRIPVTDPATGAVIGEVALADRAHAAAAIAVSAAAAGWARTAPRARGRLLHALSRLLDRDRAELASLITLDNGKTARDADAEISRASEHLEAAAGAAPFLVGDLQHDVIPGLDGAVLREPIGPCAIVSPFNFPIMTGSIYWAWALACGNPVIIKPSEQAPLAATRLGELFLEAGFPPGVVTILHGGRDAVEALCDSPDVAAVSLIGSTATARAVFERASRAGKRAQTAGGARNPLVVMPDAPVEATADGVVASAFTMAGQRCLSASVLVLVGDAGDDLLAAIVERSRGLVVGAGNDATTTVPPLISRASVDAAVAAIDAAETEGGTVLLDGRDAVDPDGGYFFGPTIVDGVRGDGHLVHAELFGPVLAVVRVPDLDAALDVVNGSPFGNAGSIFTRDGAASRRFTAEAKVGNIGINVGVVAPTADFGFGGRRGSFFGTIHSQGRYAVEFFTDIKSVSTRWV